ncbi:hypothetical protein IW261DRAFT_1498692 [Armillaria novae-zelandiae]|uniref:Uncharacterized protein n=1 Tax=Armillaria novae-zelandiae TaxID=153914 RepID=A0AA39NZS4_9AGAR|nr:hypothetical protein IW261DRAFT_1498692 [Armillaria novae-zelandiae]
MLNLQKLALEPPMGLGTKLLYGTVSSVILLASLSLLSTKLYRNHILFSLGIYSAIYSYHMCHLYPSLCSPLFSCI